MRRGGVLAVRKMRGQVAVILHRRRILAPQQIHIAAGIKRLGQPLALRKARSISATMLRCSSRSSRLRANSISRYKPPRAVLVLRVGQRLGLGVGQPLQLQLAGRRGHGKSRSRARHPARLPRQRMILLAGLLVAASVVVGIAQAAQLGGASGCSRRPSPSAWRAQSPPRRLRGCASSKCL